MNRVTTAIHPESFAKFGDLPKYLRKRSHLPQDELGGAAGCNREQVIRLDKNQRM
jgi:hypothetical protein